MLFGLIDLVLVSVIVAVRCEKTANKLFVAVGLAVATVYSFTGGAL